MRPSAKLKENQAVALLAVIAHPTRLSVFRLLAEAGFTGLNARAIADKLHTIPPTLSSHLAVLAKWQLLRADKSVTPTRYIANVKLMRALAAYLGDQCVGAK